jgi:predicted RNase H-like HicB family nuclease
MEYLHGLEAGMMLSIYPACFYKEEEGYSVIFPDLNWLATQGDTLDEAMEMAVECLAGYLHTCQINGEMLPKPSKISDIDPRVISKQIAPDEPMGEAFVNMVSVDVAAYAKQHFEKSVRKTLTIPAWLNAAALEMDINFSQVLQEALLAKVRAKRI